MSKRRQYPNPAFQQLKENHPLIDSLVFAGYFEGGNLIAVKGGMPSSNEEIATSTPRGFEVFGGPAGDPRKLTFRRPGGLSQVRGTVLLNFRSTGGTPAILGKFLYADNGGLQFYRGGTDTSVRLEIATSQAPFTGLPNLYDANEHQLAATWEDVSNIRQLRVDGIWQTNNTTAFTPNATRNDLTLGNQGPTDSRRIGGVIGYCLIFSEVLPRSEIESLEANPYQFLITEQIIIPIYLPLVAAPPAPPVCDQILAPDVLQIQTNLSGVIADINESVDTPDANWLVSP